MAARFAALVLPTACVAVHPWYAEVNNYAFPSIASTQLDADSFNWTSQSSWQSSCVTYALINFYAPWCPHCQHFASEFERLSTELNEYSGSPVFTGSVDCDQFADLCHLWNVTGYPTLRFGTCAQWLMPDATAHLQHIPFQLNTAEKVAVWINNNSNVAIDSEQILSKEDFGHQVKNPSQAASPHVLGITVDLWDVQLAVALLFRNAFSTHDFQGERRQALLDFIHLLAERLPELGSTQHGSTGDAYPCRTSLQNLHSNLTANSTKFMKSRPVSWRSTETEQVVDPTKVEENWRLCGTDWQDYAKGWVSCRGTWPGTRGYTCGVWSMLHTLASANNASVSSSVVQDDHNKIRAMLWYFFDCNGCRDHFFNITVSEGDVVTAARNQLWWWFAHNTVNQRVGKLENSDNNGDPKFPHVQWPQAPDCTSVPAGGRGSHVSLMAVKHRLHLGVWRRSSQMEQSLADSSTQCGLDSAEWSSAKAVARKGPAPKVGDPPLDKEASTLSKFLVTNGWDSDCVWSYLNTFYLGL